MIGLNFDVFRDLCIKYNLEPLDSIYNQINIVKHSFSIWGKNIEGSFKQIAIFSPMYGVKINIPFKVTNQKWDWLCGVWLVSYDEVEKRFSLMGKNLKLMKIDNRIKDIDKDFVCKKNCLI